MTGPVEGRRGARWTEGLGLCVALGAIALLLLRAYELQPYSDPVHWFLFGRHFSEAFARTDLAYGFPLLLSAAIALVGREAAWLTNLPLLVALGAAVYAFARLHFERRDGEPELGPVAGASALLLLVAFDAERLLRLVNPFRDPLAHLLLVTGCALALRFRRDPRTAWAALAGICLGLASSTREVSVLALPPLLLYALLARWQGPRLPLLRPIAAFGVAFAVAIAPFLVQNALLSGNPLLPGQAAVTYEEEGLVPGVRASHFAAQAPRLAAALFDHLGVAGLGLVALGLLAAVARRNVVVLALSAPALLLYTAFYAGYERVVARYLFVLDLFALPIAGFGVAALVAWAGARLPVVGRLAPALSLGLFAAVAGLAFAVSEAPRARVRLADAAGFVRHVEAAVGSDAIVVGTRPLIDVVRAFGDLETQVPDHRWELRFAATRFFANPGRSWLLTNDPVAVRIVESQFDLVDTLRFEPDDYGLDEELGDSPIRLGRVVPWTRKLATEPVRASATGPFALGLDVGARASRRGAPLRVLWNGAELPFTPRHRVDFAPVRVTEAPSRNDVSISSDDPVPARFKASLLSLEGGLPLSFEEEDLEPYMDRFSTSFLMRPKLGYPTLTSGGTLVIPTMSPGGVAYVVKARMGLLRGFGRGSVTVRTSVSGQRLSETPLGSPGRRGDERWKWRSVQLVIPPELARSTNTRIHWSLETSEPGEPGPIAALQGLRVFREALEPSTRIDLASARAARFLERGFYGSPIEGGRWTEGAASLRLVVARAPEPAQLVVTYRSAASVPSFALDGKALRGTRVPAGEDGRVTATFDVGRLDSVSPRLAIRSATRSRGDREVGLLLESVELRRSP